MIRIGDFSKLSRVSVKTLRFYDAAGLLKPASVDPFTGYRYYEASQLPRINRILALKDLGFSLEAIRAFLADSLPPDQLRGMLKLRQAEIRQRVAEETERLERVEARLRQIEQEDNRMAGYDVLIKAVEPILVAGIRDTVPTPPEQGLLWHELDLAVSTQPFYPSGDPPLTVYYDEAFQDRDWDIEVCVPLERALPESARVKVHWLPDVKTMACTIHHGPLANILEAYQAIGQWIGGNGYHICGPAREVTIQMGAVTAAGASQTDPNMITEIQYPVEKG